MEIAVTIFSFIMDRLQPCNALISVVPCEICCVPSMAHPSQFLPRSYQAPNPPKVLSHLPASTYFFLSPWFCYLLWPHRIELGKFYLHAQLTQTHLMTQTPKSTAPKVLLAKPLHSFSHTRTMCISSPPITSSLHNLLPTSPFS